MHIRPAAFALLACLLQSAPASPTSGEPIRYHVGFDRDAKTWSVAMTIPLPKAAPFELWIPRWTPGAYHLADFAQNVTTLSAADASGNSMKVTRHEPVVFWTIDPGAATRAVVNYQATPPKEGPLAVLDALEASAIAKTRANVTPCSLLAFVPEWKDRPVEVELDLPADWTVATALDRRADGVFTAPSYLRLEDSPFLMGRRLQVEAFEASGARHEVATLGKTEEETKELAGECEKIVESASRMMGGVPYRRYVFLFGFVGGGGGLEHSYSTLILLPKASPKSEVEHVAAHEYFHLWNAERIHVEGIEHPDLTKPFTTGTIWLNEGGTEYVSSLLLVDAKLETESQFFTALGRNHEMVHSMKELLTKRSWLDVSRAFTNATMQDLIEIAITHYQEGSVVLFALDLEMRRASGGERGIPDLMRYLFENYAKKGRGYGEDELPSILNRVAGGDLAGFYDKYIAGKDMVDLSNHLDVIGMRIDDGAISEVDHPTAPQLAARRKLFAIAK